MDRRGDRLLLVWGEIPHWMVVDGDLAALLQRLDGSTTLSALLQERPDWKRYSQAIVEALQGLIDLGVVQDRDRERPPVSNAPASLPPIESVALNLTHRCNLRCSYCYRGHQPASAPVSELTDMQIRAFLDEVRPLCSDRPSLVILGGEPLLRESKLLRVARHARGHGFVTIVSTNGLLVSDEFARQARSIGLQVQVSLDGPDAATNDITRGGGSFVKALAGIRTLVRRRAYTLISSVVHRHTLAALEAFFDLAIELGVDEARFIPLKLMGGAAPETTGSGSNSAGVPDHHVTLVEIVEHVREMLERRPEFLSLMKRDALSILGNQCRWASRRVSCGVGRQTLLLDADGKCYPCLNTNRPELCFGDVTAAGFDLEETWRNSSTLADLRARTMIDSAHSSCAGCVVRYWCLAGCRGETLAMTGRLDRPSPHCVDQKRAIVEMLWLLTDHPDWIEKESTVC